MKYLHSKITETVRRSVYCLPSLVHTYLSFLFLCLIVLSSCAADNSAALLHDLKNGRYDFFLQADNAAYRSIKKMGHGSAYYVGLHLKHAGYAAAARFYFVLGEKFYEAPFNALCREQLYETGEASECLVSVQTRLKQLEKQSDQEAQIEKDRLTAVRLRLLLTLKAYTDIAAAPEQLYFAGVITQQLVEAFPQLGAAMKPVDRGLAICRINVFEKLYKDAWAAAQASFAADALPAALAHAALLSDIGKAGLYGASGFADGAAFFESLAEKVQKESAAPLFSQVEKRRILFYTSFYAARCRAKMGKANQRERAAQLFLQAADTADTAADVDSALWYYLDTVRQLSLRRYLAALADTVSRWNNPRWYADLVQAVRVELTAAKDWDKLQQLYAILAKTSLPEQRAALAYTLARSATFSQQETSRFLHDVVSGSAAVPYYRIMAAYRLGGPIEQAFAGRPVSSARESVSTNAGRKTSSLQKQPGSMSVQDAHVYISGLLHFGLYSLVYPQVTVVYPSITLGDAAQFASTMQAEGLYADAIRLMSFSLRNQENLADDAQLRLLYPRPYQELVAKYAAAYQLPEYLLYALIRSESLFQAEIISGAGAVGLTQLMPTTAADIAKKCKVSDYSLTDPEMNIRFGAYYLAEMIRRLDNRIMPACFAYNAGISRVRSWQQHNKGLPDDLFLESLDYAETRDYGRKILAAAVVYGVLYYDEKPEDIVEFFFSPGHF